MCWGGSGEAWTPAWIVCFSLVDYEMGNPHSIHLDFGDTLPLSACTEVESSTRPMPLVNILCRPIAQSGSVALSDHHGTDGLRGESGQTDMSNIQSQFT